MMLALEEKRGLLALLALVFVSSLIDFGTGISVIDLEKRSGARKSFSEIAGHLGKSGFPTGNGNVQKFTQDHLMSESSSETGGKFENVQDGEPTRCGYKACNSGKEGLMNVHIVSHTHDDVGWLKTMEQYFVGARQGLYPANVRQILDSTIWQLTEFPERRFTYVEMAFFYLWWQEQDAGRQDVVRRLVNEGRLEFTLGGWSMNDEASTHYTAIIDQLTLGHRFLRSNFGQCGRPRVAWQVDPFGHSREQAALFAEMGFDAVFNGRIDYADMAKRRKDKTLNMIWKGRSDARLHPKESWLFADTPYNTYCTPGGFNFEDSMHLGIVSEPKFKNYNVDQFVERFLDVVRQYSKPAVANHIMVPFGCDFTYEKAARWFSNIDRLIKAVNARQANGSKVNVFYSTPSCYIYGLNKANKTWTTKSDDFFPYADRPHSYWSGYFTSRAALKFYARQANAFLQACYQLIGFSASLSKNVPFLYELKKALGVLQHHDAISGTAKQHVTFDYAKILSVGVKAGEALIADSLRHLRLIPGHGPVSFCPQMQNLSQCAAVDGSRNVQLVIYNSMSWSTRAWIRLPVTSRSRSVLLEKLGAIPSEIVKITARTVEIPERQSRARYELIFQVPLPAFGAQVVQVKATAHKRVLHHRHQFGRHFPEGLSVLENSHLKLAFDPKTGSPTSLLDKRSGKSSSLHQQLMYYASYVDKAAKRPDACHQPASGAYLFRPLKATPRPFMNPSAHVTVSLVRGNLVQELHSEVQWKDAKGKLYTVASQVVRLYKDASHVEIEWTVGPIPRIGTGVEVINRICSDLKSNGIFFTDANGRQTLKRQRNYRPTWKLNLTEPVASNYYPVNSFIFLRDEKTLQRQLTVLNDRSQGGSSMQDGCLELMVHRRTLCDDAKGVGEPLSEIGKDGKGLIVRGTHYLILDTPESSSRRYRSLAKRVFHTPTIAVLPLSSTASLPFRTFFRVRNAPTTWSALNATVPPNVHILTHEMLTYDTLLLRLEHIYDVGEDKTYSGPAKIALQSLFKNFTVASVVELTLSANQYLSDAKRLVWRTQNGLTPSQFHLDPIRPRDFVVTLQPFEIRTFHVKFSRK